MSCLTTSRAAFAFPLSMDHVVKNTCCREYPLKTVRSRSLIHKFLLFLGALLLIAVSALVLIDRYVFTPALLADEDRLIADELSHIEASLLQNRDALLAKTRDWAHWDDTYRFVQGDHATYADSNFSQEMFEDLEYQLMVFFNERQQVVWVAGIDPATGEYGSCAGSLHACGWAVPIIQRLGTLLPTSPLSGEAFILSEPLPALAAVVPVLPTDRIGPTRGWLAELKLIDSRITSALEEQTGLPVTVKRHPAVSVPGNNLSIRRQQHHTLATGVLKTHGSDPALSLITEVPRDRFHTGARTFRYALAWTAALLLTVMALVVLLLVHLVVKPLSLLTGVTRRQRGHRPSLHHDDPSTVPASLLRRRDEFGNLARHLQATIDHQNHQARTLRRLSEQDPLTSLANRRLFDTRLEQWLRNHPDSNLSVLMIDIDHFKLFNDHYGHPEGDACLIRVGQRMQEHVRPYGFLVARTGGEEFSVLMPGVAHEQACAYAEALRRTVVELAIPHAASPTGEVITMSIGVSSKTVAERPSGATLMRKADINLYEAKAGGRNRVAGCPEANQATLVHEVEG